MKYNSGLLSLFCFVGEVPSLNLSLVLWLLLSELYASPWRPPAERLACLAIQVLCGWCGVP
jgi:hypothetical protein